MTYEVFPFGKYKGVLLTELQSTYIVYALEEFALPDELKNDLLSVLAGRIGLFQVHGLVDYHVYTVAKELKEKIEAQYGVSSSLLEVVKAFEDALFEELRKLDC